MKIRFSSESIEKLPLIFAYITFVLRELTILIGTTFLKARDCGEKLIKNLLTGAFVQRLITIHFYRAVEFQDSHGNN